METTVTLVPVKINTWEGIVQVSFYSDLSFQLFAFLLHTFSTLSLICLHLFLPEVNLTCANITWHNGGSCLYINETHNAECICHEFYFGQLCKGKQSFPIQMMKGYNTILCCHLKFVNEIYRIIELLNPYPADQILEPFQPLLRLTKVLLSIFIHSLPSVTNLTDLHFSCSYCQHSQ